MVLIGSVVNYKYMIMKQLGCGGTSVVFKAQDVTSGKIVAVKFMKEKVTSAYIDDVIRFRREVEAISKIDHPNIIKVFEAAEFDGIPYIVMEMLNGESLKDILKSGKVFSREDALEIISQLTEALDYVHRKGIIHRDLKPGNIYLLSGRGELCVKLLDFGLALITEISEIYREDEAVGTFGYMSPEATGILNRDLDERSDLYSIGIILYQMLTGNRPFNGKSVSELLHQQVTYIPPSPEKINPQIEEILGKITLKMLSKEPYLRYQSAKGLLNDIRRCQQGEKEFVVGEKDQNIKLAYQTRLIGRESEIEKIKQCFRNAKKGMGSLCFVMGEAGIGKSRLVEEIRGYVYEQNGVFIRGRCLDHINKMPYQPFRDAVDDFINIYLKLDSDKLDTELKRLEEVLGDLGDIVLRLNPRMEKLIGKAKKLVPLEPERENQRFLMVLTSFFCQIVERKSACILFLDDLQWADEGTLSLLRGILKEVGNANLLILGTYRNNEIGESHGINRIINNTREKNFPIEEIKLLPFNREAMACFIDSILGEKNHRLENAYNYIWENSDGNPLFIINLINELIENRVIVWNGQKWEEVRQKLKEMPVSKNMVEIILRRMECLTEEEIDILCKGAIIGREFEVDLLHNLSNLNKDKLIFILDKIALLHVLAKSTQRGKFLFVHDKIRDVFYSKLNAYERQRIHLKIAGLIEKRKDNDSKVLFELVHHYIEGGDEDKVLEYIFAAAEVAKLSYANEEAIRYFKAGIDLMEKEGRKQCNEWFKANIELMEILLTIGSIEEVAAMSEMLMPLIEKSGVEVLYKAGFYKKSGMAYYKKGDYKSSIESLVKGLEVFGVKMPGSVFKTVFMCSKELIVCLLGEILPVFFLKSRKSLSEYNEMVLILYSLCRNYSMTNLKKLAIVSFMIFSILAIRLRKSKEMGWLYSGLAMFFSSIAMFKLSFKCHKIALNIRGKLNDKWGIAQSMQYTGITCTWSGKYSKSISAYKCAMDMFRKIGDIYELGMSMVGLGEMYLRTSCYNKSEEYLEILLETAQKTNDYFGIACAKDMLACCYIESGDYGKAEEFLKSGMKLIKDKRLLYVYCGLLWHYGYLESEKGNYDRAIEILNEAKELDEKNRFIKEHIVMLYAMLADASIKRMNQLQKNGAGVPKSEYSKIAGLCRKALRKTKPWPNNYGVALRAAANYYAAAERNKKAEKYYLKAIKHNKTLGRKFEAAKSYFEYAVFLQILGYNDKADINLRKGLKMFKQIGSQPYTVKCEQMLGIMTGAGNNISILSSRERLAVERRVNAVIATGRYISSVLDIDELLAKIIDSAIELVGAERGILLLYQDSDEKRLEVSVARNVSKEEINGKEFAASRSIIARIEKEKKPLIVSDAMLDEELKRKSSVILHGLRSIMCTPVMNKGQMLGVIYLDNSLLSGLFSIEDLNIMDSISRQAGVSIENAKLYNRLSSYLKEIEEWNQTLEQRVAERTEQLADANRELNEKNDELFAMNEQLKEYASTVQELTLVKERNRFAMDVHDTLGHTMASLIRILEVCVISLKEDPEITGSKLCEAKEVARKGLEELRRSITGLVSERLTEGNLVNALKVLIEDFQRSSGIAVDFSVEGTDNSYSSLHSETVYKACQEALTNSLRHGKAKNVIMVLKFFENKLKLLIVDDGCGCKDMKKGFGLMGMDNRVKNLNGSIVYGSDGENGFNIRIEIPWEV